MDATTLTTLISNVGFPIACTVGLAYFCMTILRKSEDTTNRIFELYDKANTENRSAIESCTKAIERLCDKLDAIERNKEQ